MAIRVRRRTAALELGVELHLASPHLVERFVDSPQIAVPHQPRVVALISLHQSQPQAEQIITAIGKLVTKHRLGNGRAQGFEGLGPVDIR